MNTKLARDVIKRAGNEVDVFKERLEAEDLPNDLKKLGKEPAHSVDGIKPGDICDKYNEFSEEMRPLAMSIGRLMDTTPILGLIVAVFHSSMWKDSPPPEHFQKWDFDHKVDIEVMDAQEQLGIDNKTAPTPELIAKLREKLEGLGRPNSAANHMIDYYNKHGLSFEDWYYLWELMAMSEVTCKSGLSPDSIFKICDKHIEQGRMSVAHKKAVKNLVDFYVSKGDKSMYIGQYNF